MTYTVMNGNGMRVLVYDLTSENRPILKDTVFFNRLKSLRMRATQQLYRLGIPCTESVILVHKRNENKIQYVIDRILSDYNYLLAEIRSDISVNLPQPVIRVLSVSEDQLQVFRELAGRRIRDLIDAHVDRVSSILEVQNGRDLRKLIRSLKKLRREWVRIRRICVDLEIGLDREIDYLMDLIDDAIFRILSQSRGDAL
jgi:hypothetical protein